MYNEQLEKLIDMALMDGVLTEKEKQILFKKAESFGIDLDEFEMVLDAKLFEKQKRGQPALTDATAVAPKSVKFGVTNKCPSCGAPIQSLSIQCPDCNHEFREIQANASAKELFRLLEDAQNMKVPEEDGGALNKVLSGGVVGLLFGNSKYDEQQKALSLQKHHIMVSNKKKQIISDFPIPSTKDDIFEFLALTLPNAIPYKDGFWKELSGQQETHNLWCPIWRSKCEQVINKARILFRDDLKLLAEVEKFNKQLNTKK